MSEPLVIKSLFREYTVSFVDDFMPSLRDEKGFFIVDKKIYTLYGEKLQEAIPRDRLIKIEATETNKSFIGTRKFIESLVKKNIRKNHTLIAVGGGITQDITSFIASILFRGIKWSFYPTTLLAQADSCIGSKTSINLGNKKNLIGNFYPPSRIIIDPHFLNTLTPKEIKSGVGEILHFFFYAGSPFTAGLMEKYDDLIKSPELFTEFIKESLSIKKAVIEVDEFDKGERNKFNFGHTFGHALETLTNFAISHGQAVTVGMDIANYISQELGYMTEKTFNEMHAILQKNLPAYDLSGFDLDAYFQALSKDKKNVGADLVCILANKPGSMAKVQIPLDDKFKRIIAAYFERYKFHGR